MYPRAITYGNMEIRKYIRTWITILKAKSDKWHYERNFILFEVYLTAPAVVKLHRGSRWGGCGRDREGAVIAQ
jgi:hypothetical protein